MDMQKHIFDQLSSMDNLPDREVLREIFEQVFIHLYSETQSKYEALETRIRDELPFHSDSYAISGTVMPNRDVTRQAWLFPIVWEDLKAAIPSPVEIHDEIKEKKEAVLCNIFVEADYLICRELENRQGLFSGTLTSGGQSYPIRVKLRPSKRYIERIGSLYRFFMSNAIPWVTVNHPYLAKFFDVVCVGIDGVSEVSAEEPGEIDIAYDKYAPFIKHNLIPVWNIERMTVKGEDFPIPALDKVNYEYHFPLSDDMSADGYIIEDGAERVSAVRRESGMLIVTSPFKGGLTWNMLRIHQRAPSVTEQFQFPLFDNRQEDSFAGRMVRHFNIEIKTKAELFRILQSFTASELITFQDFSISKQMGYNETWEANSFIRDEIRDIDTSKTLLLRFSPAKRNFFLNRDIMSFLTSQVQLIYPEYHCVGVIA